MSRYAITDIHGCARTFQHLLGEIDFGREDELFLLGDYIDRGPDSKGVLEYIWQLQGEGYAVRCLRGNHEQMLIEALSHGRGAWDYSPRRRDRKQTLHWMSQLPYYLETPGYLLVHAGLSFEERDPLADQQAMLWARDWETTLDRSWLGERIVVYGHTPRPATEVAAEVASMAERQLVCLDAGCAMHFPGMGTLAALNLDTREVRFLARLD